MLCKTLQRIRKIQDQQHVDATLRKIRLSGEFAMKLRMETSRERRIKYLINIYERKKITTNVP